MKTLCSAAETSEPEQAEALQALMRRQLPQITQRLQGTLEKLQDPKQKAETGKVSAQIWWQSLQYRYTNSGIDFLASKMAPNLSLPADLFDSVSDNLIQNALEKRKQQNGLKVSVRFTCEPEVALRVCDDGTAADANVARKLFAGPVPSEWGLGVGLYQAARQAEQTGYQLELAENKDGQVCFVLHEAAV